MIWTAQRLEPLSPLFGMIHRFDVRGSVDPQLFQAAFHALVQGTDAMRIVFGDEDAVPRQRVLDTFGYRPEFIDVSGEEDPNSALDEWIEGRSSRVLDLRACAYDCALLKSGPDRFTWYLNQHHLTTDAWSTALVFQRLSDLYRRIVEGDDPSDAVYPSYTDYLAHERGLRGSAAHSAALEHLESLARDAPAPARLYGRSPRNRTGRTERFPCALGPERSRRVRAFAESPGVRTISPDLSLFNVFAAALVAYVWRVSGTRELVLGTPAHNRSSRAFRETVGLFIEMFPLRVDLDETDSFRELLRRVNASSQRLLRHAVPGTSSPESLRRFNVVLNYITSSFGDFAGMPTESRWLHSGHGDPDQDLGLHVHDFEGRGEFTVSFDFNTDTFPRDDREAAVAHFLALLDAALADPDMPLGDVALTTREERQRLVVDYNEPGLRAVQAPSVIDSFYAQADRDPSRVALVEGERAMTYGELEDRVRRLASRLKERGAGRGAIVGIHADRSIDMVVGVLAVLASGAAYVPLELDLPERRLDYMLSDTGAALVLTRPDSVDRIRGKGVEVLDLGGDAETSSARPAPTAEGGAARGPVPSRDQAAYVIYTSGSTGTPKGVVVDHGALGDYVGWAWKTYAGGEPVDMPLYSSFGFDLTVTSLFVPLVSGGKLVIYPEEGRASGLAVLDVFEEDRVDVVKLTPAHLRLVAESGSSPARIRTLVLGGEDLETALAERVVRQSGGSIEIFNEYGPTEAVVGCMVHRFDPARDRGTSVPIGVPAGGVRIYLLDRGDNPVPPGVAGELCIGGSRLARGYLNREAETEIRFVVDPFVEGGRMYRTGDLARFGERGLVEFLGRSDDQVKIGGVRVELAEVEHALLDHPDVRQCVALADADRSTPGIVAYLVHDRRPSDSELRAFLADRLPRAMVPSVFARLESIPLTSNGKVDRAALRVLHAGQHESPTAYRAPVTSTEARLSAIWLNVLDVPRVGLDDNFFDLGGDSLAAIRVASRASAADIPLNPRDLFRHQTVAALAARVEERPGGRGASGVSAASRGDPLPGIDIDPSQLAKLAAALKRGERA